MALRIEYFLILALIILLLSVLRINPISQDAVESNSSKELVFTNFSLIELKENQIGNALLASETTKYTNYLDMKEINLTSDKGDMLLATQGIYRDDVVYLKENVELKNHDNYRFLTDSIDYNVDAKYLKGTASFTLDIYKSHFKGDNLEYNMTSQEVKANHIEASIFFEPRQ